MKNMNKKTILETLTLAAHRAYDRGIQTGSGGNISARMPGQNRMVVKSSGGSLADCREDGEGWVTVDFDGRTEDAIAPSREWRLHAALLESLPQIGGIVHCHAPWSIAWSREHDYIPLATWHSRLKWGIEIPILDIQAAIVPPEELPGIVKLFHENRNLPGIVLRGHGLIALGKDAAEAEHTAEMIEETAQICILQELLHQKENGKE